MVLAIISPYWMDLVMMSTTRTIVFGSIGAFTVLVVIKTIIGLSLINYSGYLHNLDVTNGVKVAKESKFFASSGTSVNTSVDAADETLETVERYTSIEGRVVG